jgi:hypothetical protein
MGFDGCWLLRDIPCTRPLATGKGVATMIESRSERVPRPTHCKQCLAPANCLSVPDQNIGHFLLVLSNPSARLAPGLSLFQTYRLGAHCSIAHKELSASDGTPGHPRTTTRPSSPGPMKNICSWPNQILQPIGIIASATVAPMISSAPCRHKEHTRVHRSDKVGRL